MIPAGNITSITDSLVSGRTQALTYDDLNRVAGPSGVYGSQSYTYDGVGNRLTRVLGGTTETYAYATAANQVATITTSSNTRSFSYLASGQVSQDVRHSADTYTFAANDNGRNASAALNGTTAGAYLYNAFEQRVQKTVGSAVTQFVFDRFGHLLAEANASGTTQKEYIWLDDVPVALVDNTGTAPRLYFIHTDQLGSPQKLTGPAGSIVWDATFDPFGNPQFVSGGGVWGTSVWGSFTWGADLSLTNLRFPGQYTDAETALNQNWFRDYDPTIGRYTQSDPIGLGADTNTYIYSRNSPIFTMDPTGLSSCPLNVGQFINQMCLLARAAGGADCPCTIMLIQSGFESGWGTGPMVPDNNFFGLHNIVGDLGSRPASRNPKVTLPINSAPEQSYRQYCSQCQKNGIHYKNDRQFITAVTMKLDFSHGTQNQYIQNILKMISECKDQLASCCSSP